MKPKQQFDTAINILLLLLISLIIFSCAESKYHDTEQNVFVVTDIKQRNGMTKMTTYKVIMLDASGIGESTFWVVDSVNKYKIGDRLCLQSCK